MGEDDITLTGGQAHEVKMQPLAAELGLPPNER